MGSKEEKIAQLYEKADQLRDKRAFEEIIKIFDEILKLSSHKYDAWNHQGNILTKLNRYEEAIVSYNKAIENNPEKPYAW